MKIVAVTNRKGGVGKSTMSTHIAQVLAASGSRVGIVDTDSQGHAALFLNMVQGQRDDYGNVIVEDKDANNGLYRALIERAPVSDVVLDVPAEQYAVPGSDYQAGTLCLLPSSDRTYRVPLEINQGQIFAFLELVEEMADLKKLDVVLVDTNPTLNLFDAWVFMAADSYIFVTECEQMAFDGIKSATEQIGNIRATRKRYLGRDSELMGIIPNKFRASTFVHKQNISFLGEAFPGKVWSPVNLRTAWVDASEMRLPIYRTAPRDQGTRDIFSITRKVQEGLGWVTAPATN